MDDYFPWVPYMDDWYLRSIAKITLWEVRERDWNARQLGKYITKVPNCGPKISHFFSQVSYFLLGWIVKWSGIISNHYSHCRFCQFQIKCNLQSTKFISAYKQRKQSGKIAGTQEWAEWKDTNLSLTATHGKFVVRHLQKRRHKCTKPSHHGLKIGLALTQSRGA